MKERRGAYVLWCALPYRYDTASRPCEVTKSSEAYFQFLERHSSFPISRSLLFRFEVLIFLENWYHKMWVFYMISLPLTLGMVVLTLKYFAGPEVRRYVYFTVGYTWFCSISIIILVPADIWTVICELYLYFRCFVAEFSLLDLLQDRIFFLGFDSNDLICNQLTLLRWNLFDRILKSFWLGPALPFYLIFSCLNISLLIYGHWFTRALALWNTSNNFSDNWLWIWLLKKSVKSVWRRLLIILLFF